MHHDLAGSISSRPSPVLPKPIDDGEWIRGIIPKIIAELFRLDVLSEKHLHNYGFFLGGENWTTNHFMSMAVANSYIYIYLRLPMYAKLLPFQELLLAALFSAAKQFLHFLSLACVCRFWNGEKPQRNGEKTQRNGEKARRNGEKNQEPKMCKLKRQKIPEGIYRYIHTQILIYQRVSIWYWMGVT